MALRADRRVLCFDGWLYREQDASLADDLEDCGLFVVRSHGGDAVRAALLADAIRNRHATVIVYDWCLAACASYLLLASAEAFVPGETLVAWRALNIEYGCISFEEAIDGGPKRLERRACRDASPEYQDAFRKYDELDVWFYSSRIVVPVQMPPESVVVRRILRSSFEGIGVYRPNLYWTWNPRFYAGTIRTKIFYEAYPKSQDEVDALARRLYIRVIYDP